jgi:hypothetical protein
MCTDPVSAYTPDHLSRSPRFGLELARRGGPCSHPRPPRSKRFAETVESGPETALGGVDEAPSRCGGVEPLRCECGAERELIACVVDRSVAGKILRHLGLPDEPPRMAPSRAPPVLEFGTWTLRGMDPSGWEKNGSRWSDRVVEVCLP